MHNKEKKIKRVLFLLHSDGDFIRFKCKKINNKFRERLLEQAREREREIKGLCLLVQFKITNSTIELELPEQAKNKERDLLVVEKGKTLKRRKIKWVLFLYKIRWRFY